MKASKGKIMIAAGIISASCLVSVNSSAQDRKLPDGTIVYSDGTRKLPNGTIIYKDSKTANNGGTNVSLPDGNIIYPDGTRSYPNDRRNNGNRKKLPPGQAKKIYGGDARDYAPGQQKKWKGKKAKGNHEQGENERGQNEQGNKGHQDNNNDH